MNRRQLVTGLAAVPIALALPAGAVADAVAETGAAVGTPEALAEARAFLVARLEAARGLASCYREIVYAGPKGGMVHWRMGMSSAARLLAEFDEGAGPYRDLALYGKTPGPAAQSGDAA